MATKSLGEFRGELGTLRRMFLNTQKPKLTWEGPDIETTGGGRVHGEVMCAYPLLSLSQTSAYGCCFKLEVKLDGPYSLVHLFCSWRTWL